MKDTCTFDNCFFAELIDRKEQCPNYVQTGWTDDKGKFKLLEDCAPRRIVFEIQALSNRLVGVQASNEEQRNTSSDLINAMGQVVQVISENPQARVTLGGLGANTKKISSS